MYGVIYQPLMEEALQGSPPDGTWVVLTMRATQAHVLDAVVH